MVPTRRKKDVRRWSWLLVGALILTSAQAVGGQDVGAAPNFGDLELEESFFPDPRSVSLTSGGTVEVNVGGCDYGFVSDAPDVDLYYATSGRSGLYVYAEGEGDIMLLVNAPDGSWACDDDSLGRLDPVLHFPDAADGLYSVWVGSYGEEYLDATLHVSEIDPGLPASEGEPDLALDPTYGDVELSEGFVPDPHEITLTAGGEVGVAVGECDYGHVANAPDVGLYYETSGSSDLYIWVESEGDATLLVNRPDGSWICDDDGFDARDPLVVLPGAGGGLYDLWVGTYGEELQDATLYISGIDPR